jgi:hypothetical protein
MIDFWLSSLISQEIQALFTPWRDGKMVDVKPSSITRTQGAVLWAHRSRRRIGLVP